MTLAIHIMVLQYNFFIVNLIVYYCLYSTQLYGCMYACQCIGLSDVALSSCIDLYVSTKDVLIPDFSEQFYVASKYHPS